MLPATAPLQFPTTFATAPGRTLADTLLQSRRQLQSRLFERYHVERSRPICGSMSVRCRQDWRKQTASLSSPLYRECTCFGGRAEAPRLWGAPTASFEEQLSRELAAFAECAATADFREGIKAFSERRKPVFQGH